jgi:hypothetical protein
MMSHRRCQLANIMIIFGTSGNLGDCSDVTASRAILIAPMNTAVELMLSTAREPHTHDGFHLTSANRVH